MKNSLFNSLFLMNLFFFFFLCVLKRYHVWLFIVKNWGLEWLPDDVRFVPKPNFNVEKTCFS